MYFETKYIPAVEEKRKVLDDKAMEHEIQIKSWYEFV